MKNTPSNGFTLIELLAVILIVAILVAWAIPAYERAVENTRVAEAKIILKSIYDANNIYNMSTGNYTSDVDELEITIPGESEVVEGTTRINTKTFQYGAGADDTLAFAVRLPTNDLASYTLRILKGVPGIVLCSADTQAGIDKCIEFSDGVQRGDYYVIP